MELEPRQAEAGVLEAEARALKEHDLLASIQSRDYHAAVDLAFELGHSFRLWGVLHELMETPSRQPPALRFDPFVAGWSDARLAQCLGFVQEWNTNAAKATVAQALLGSVLRCVPMARLRGLPGLAGQIEALVPYTERHFHRVDRLVQATFVIDYTCAAMSAIGALDAPVGALL